MDSNPTITQITSNRYEVTVRNGSVVFVYNLRTGEWEARETSPMRGSPHKLPDVTEARAELRAHLQRTGERPAIIRGVGMHS